MFENDQNEVDTTKVVEETEEQTEEETTEEVDYKSKFEEAQAEIAKYKRMAEQKAKKLEKSKTEIYKSTSDDIDYGVLAFLEVKGVKSNEHDFIKEEMKKSGAKSYKELFDNEYFLHRLEKQRELDRTKQATPSGKRSNAVATDSVEYWASKPFSEVPRDMKAKVVAYRENKETGTGVFYNS